VLTALANSSIKFVNTRHEQIAAHIADGYARAKKPRPRWCSATSARA
jgi:acetolactate synthase-1/2/3 large subunit